MKKAEKIEIGRQCVHKMIDENLSYKDLELFTFNDEVYSKETLKKFMELFIQNESMENPDNPVIAEFQNYKLKLVSRSSKRLTIDQLLSVPIDMFKEALNELSDEQNKKRLDVLTSDKTRASEVAPYVKAISDYFEKKSNAKDQVSYKPGTEGFDSKLNYVIDLYMSSPVIELRNIRVDSNVMEKQFFFYQIRNIREEIENGGNNYSDQIKAKVAALLTEVRRRQEEARDVIEQIVSYIQNGIVKDGKLERFSLFDYYTITKYDVPDLAAAAKSLSNSEDDPLEKCSTVLAYFRDEIYKYDHRTNKENIIKFQYTENGRVLFSDEIDGIIAYMEARNIPLTQKTYQGAYHEYVNGRLQIKKK